MPRTVCEQVLHQLHALLAREDSRPADDIQLVEVAASDGVGAVFDEQVHDVQRHVFGSEVQRCRAVALVPDVRIGAAFEEKGHHRRTVAVHGEVQSSAPARVPFERRALVHDVGVRIQKRGDPRNVAALGAGEELGDCRFAIGGERSHARPATRELGLQLIPAGEAMLPRECVLHVA